MVRVLNPEEMKKVRRVYSMDDLKKEAEGELPTSGPDMLITWAVHLDDNQTWFTARQGVSLQEILDEARARMRIDRTDWNVVEKVERVHETMVYCTVHSSEEQRAVIHFGNPAGPTRANVYLFNPTCDSRR
jgi:hypothetical protein